MARDWLVYCTQVYLYQVLHVKSYKWLLEVGQCIVPKYTYIKSWARSGILKDANLPYLHNELKLLLWFWIEPFGIYFYILAIYIWTFFAKFSILLIISIYKNKIDQIWSFLLLKFDNWGKYFIQTVYILSDSTNYILFKGTILVEKNIELSQIFP